MKIHLKQIPAHGLHLDGDEDCPIHDLEAEGIRCVGPLHYNVGLGVAGGALWASGSLSQPVELRCVSCLERFVHEIQVPAFAVYQMNRVVKRSKRLKFPLLVKSISEEGSVGIARASIVNDDAKLAERVDFIHRQTKTHAIAEQYIAGREIYVGVIGNQRLQCYTPWELVIEKLPEGAPNIATSKLKWDPAYQEKVGVVTRAAELDKKMHDRLVRLSKKIYRTLFLSGYARLDYRVTESGEIYVLEANPNPQIANAEDFADSAKHCGVDYESLLQKIIGLGLRYRTGAESVPSA